MNISQNAAAFNPYDPRVVTTFRCHLVNLGYSFVPVVTDNKKCTIKNWQIEKFNPKGFYPRHQSSGFRLPDLAVIDVDTGYISHVTILMKIINTIAPGSAIRWRGNSNRCALLFRAGPGVIARLMALIEVDVERDEWGNRKKPQVEILTGARRFLHCAGMRAGAPIGWSMPDGTLGLPEVADLPVITKAQVDEIFRQIEAAGIALPKARATAVASLPAGNPTSAGLSHGALTGDGALSWAQAQRDALLADVQLHNLPKDRDLWLKGIVLPLANAAADESQNRAEYEQFANDVSKVMAGYDGLVPDKIAKEFDDALIKAGQPDRVGIGSFGFGFGLTAPGGDSITSGCGHSASMVASVQAPGATSHVLLVNRGKSAGELMKNPVIPKSLGHSLFTPGVVSLLAGMGGVGKGLLIQFLQAALSEGPVAVGVASNASDAYRSKGNVLSFSVLKEDAEGIVGARFAAIEAKHGWSCVGAASCPADCAEAFWLARAGQRGALELNPNIEAELAELASEGFRVLIIDSAQLVAGSIILDNAHVAALVGYLNVLARKHNLAVCIVNHFAKGADKTASDKIKGASAWRDTCRVVTILTRAEPNEIAAAGCGSLGGYAPNVVALDIEKANNGRVGQRDLFEIVSVPIGAFGTQEAPVMIPLGLASAAKAAVLADKDNPALQQLALDVITAHVAKGVPLSTANPTQAKQNGLACAITAIGQMIVSSRPDWSAPRSEAVAKALLTQLFESGSITKTKCSKTKRMCWRLAS